MVELVKINWNISNSVQGSDVNDTSEFEKEYWNSLTEEQQHEEMKEIVFSHVDWHYEEDF